MVKQVKVIVEKHPDGYVAWPSAPRSYANHRRWRLTRASWRRACANWRRNWR
ncbi:MAG: hypothetical protein OXU81_23030 [Gammaproteobacteria bacterium]|nr:hypothetical protein [Gammaproteobacteria bacterium]